MGGRLAANVALYDPSTHRVAVFETGTVPPRWAAELIVNPAAWQADEPTDLVDAHTTSGDGGDGGDGDSAPADGRPPLNGPGSGRDAWLAHAEGLGIEVPADASRADIVDLVDAHTTS